MGIFDGKNFNSNVFMKYVDMVPNLNRNELIKSGALKPRQDIAAACSEQTGSNYITTPLFGRIGKGTQNYDGNTTITANSSLTYSQGRVVIGRADSWVEKDFSYDITAGTDFLKQVAGQVAEYWDEVDQDTLLSTLKGIFSMTGVKNLEFVNNHTNDISANADGSGVFGATTLNNTMQKALGDNKAKFTLAIMHSAVATNLENLQLLEYMKYTDSNGIQRNLGIATLNGRTVLIDDNMPTEEVAESSLGAKDGYTKYTTYVLGNGAIEYTNCGVKVPYETDRDKFTNGGEDYLISRQRKIFSPIGISFKNSTIVSPTNSQLETGSNWELAPSTDSSNKVYPHKAIPIARVITRG